ncbi:hypothetical protein BV898_11348 [Hypsibius exemplaris]|uniref:G-protein coupled receptors family 1 profile domain-containing protein n=1 Tax=Hypsibius exemplaris TaxID=2072580 RepID=A0A1W0WH29_HYPEX|nr:hypothetical protein BV898_11348 [Hypsibius exemplaris]
MNRSQNFSERIISNDLSFTSIAAWFGARIGLTVLGSILNFSILLLVYVNKRLRAGSGILIAHLVACDFVSCFVHVPINTAMPLAHALGYNLPREMCTYVYCAYTVTFVAGTWTESCLGLNRFVAVCFPQHYRYFAAKKITHGMILFCWVIGLSVQVPTAFGVTGSFAMSNGHCHTKIDVVSSYGVFALAVSTYVPYTIIGSSCGIILLQTTFLKFYRKRKIQPRSVMGEERLPKTVGIIPSERRMAVARMLIASFVWYFLWNSPAPILTSRWPKVMAIQSVNWWMRVTLVVRMAFNPVIFYAMGSDYREALTALLGMLAARHGQIFSRTK